MRHPALLAAFALLLTASPALAGVRITTPFARTDADTLDANHLPLPERAQQLAAYNTGVLVGLGATLIALDYGVAGSGYLFAGGYITAAIGLAGGPTAGYNYGGIGRRGALGAAARLALIVGVPVVVMNRDRSRDGDERWRVFATSSLAGVGAAAILSVYDIASVDDIVRRQNRTRMPATSWRLEPAVAPFSRAPGVALTLALPPAGP
jgi:hypothetical protein